MDLSKAYRCPVTGRYYDPLRVWRDLLAESQVNQWITTADEGHLIPLARKVLALPDIDPVTGDGFLDETVLTALARVTEYLAGKGERARTSPSSAPCTDCP